MPRRRRHATIDGESPASRRRRINSSYQQTRRVRVNNSALPSQVSTPDTPQTRRRRQRRHSQRRVQGLPSATPPTPVVPVEDDASCHTYLPLTDTASVLTTTVYTADDDDRVRTTTIPSPVCETNPGVQPTIRRNLINSRENWNYLHLQH